MFSLSHKPCFFHKLVLHQNDIPTIRSSWTGKTKQSNGFFLHSKQGLSSYITLHLSPLVTLPQMYQLTVIFWWAFMETAPTWKAKRGTKDSHIPIMLSNPLEMLPRNPLASKISLLHWPVPPLKSHHSFSITTLKLKYSEKSQTFYIHCSHLTVKFYISPKF